MTGAVIGAGGARGRFDAVADSYDRGRPGYPDGLYDAVEKLAGRTLAGAVVADVAAGTGIATRAMAARGARVVALDHGPGMLAKLRARTPRIPVLVADGHALALRDGVADLVTYAQAWHWMDDERAAGEAARVLRRVGSLAVWWNLPRTEDAAWLAEHKRRVEEVCPDPHEGRRDVDPAVLRGHGLAVRRASIDWSRTVALGDFVHALRSRSYVAALGGGADALVERERRILAQRFPGGTVEVPQRAYLVVGRKGG